jgi:hypothetical protein
MDLLFLSISFCENKCSFCFSGSCGFGFNKSVNPPPVDLNNGNLSGKLIGSGKMLVGQKVTNTVDSFELNFQSDQFENPDRNIPLPLKLGWMLGFRNGIYVNALNYVSEGVVDLTGTKYLYLVLDDYNNSVSKNFYSALNSSILNNNILAQFPVVNSSPFSIYIVNVSSLSIELINLNK